MMDDTDMLACAVVDATISGRMRHKFSTEAIMALL